MSVRKGRGKVVDGWPGLGIRIDVRMFSTPDQDKNAFAFV